VVVLEQPRCDQSVSGRVLREVAESFAGALFGRAGECAVQNRGSGEVDRLAVVAQAAGDLAVVDEPWSWSERADVVSEPCEDLAGVRQRALQGRAGALATTVCVASSVAEISTSGPATDCSGRSRAATLATSTLALPATGLDKSSSPGS
jgi:hypothetical protein